MADEDVGDAIPRSTSHHATSALSLFPSSLCSAIVQIINLLDDPAVSDDGNAVYEVAYQVSTRWINIIIKLIYKYNMYMSLFNIIKFSRFLTLGNLELLGGG